MDRRYFLRNSAALASSAALGDLAFAAENVPGAAREIRVIASGGLSGESVQKGYINPYMEKTGLKVIREDTTGTPLGKLRAMVESGRIDAVLHEMGGSAVAQALALNLIQPLRWTAINPAPMFPEARHTHGMGFQYFSLASAWRADAKPLTNWRDFWDVQPIPRFPSPCLRTGWPRKASTPSTSTAPSRAWPRSRAMSRSGGPAVPRRRS
jgi:putative spermidine/putrescine transport system substrate-binding protein